MRTTTAMLLVAMAFPVHAAPVDHVLLISVDGLRADLLEGLLANDLVGDYASFQRLVDEGAFTFNARTDYSHTVTLPNHTCMITGRPVAQPVGQPVTVHHGYTANTDPGPGDTLHNQGNPAVAYVASAFDVAHDHGLTTAMYASKSKFAIHEQSYDDVSGAPDLTGPDDGMNKIDVYYQASSGNPSNASIMHAAFMNDLAGAIPHFAFIHYRDPDSAGHQSGWGSAAWNQAVRSVDQYLGDILDFVDARPGLKENLVVIVTTDHGGSGYSHITPTDSRHYTIPFFAWGADVPSNKDLYELNAGYRQDPLGGRPDYNVATAPIRNGDSGNLALALLGLPAVSGSTINGSQDLTVTVPASGVNETPVTPLVRLEAAPNPFNARTELAYAVEESGPVGLNIFDMAGRRVRTLVSESQLAGGYEVIWDGRDEAGNRASSGVYFSRLETRTRSVTKKLALVQ